MRPSIIVAILVVVLLDNRLGGTSLSIAQTTGHLGEIKGLDTLDCQTLCSRVPSTVVRRLSVRCFVRFCQQG